MDIKVEIYTKEEGIFTVSLHDSDIEALATKEYYEQSAHKGEITHIMIGDVTV